MGFSVSAAQTLDGVTNSYVISYNGSGTANIDDLQTACAAIGCSKSSSNGVVFDSGGTTRIYAINGLSEQRVGVWIITIRNGAHVCFGYTQGASNAVVLGTAEDANGIATSSVNIAYEQSAASFGDVFETAQAKCAIGAAPFTHYSGSLLHAPGADVQAFDIWKSETAGAVYFDAVSIFARHNHFLSRTNVTTTSKTRFALAFSTSMVEAVSAFRTIQPMSTTAGIRWLFPPANTTLRVLRPSYSKIDTYNGSATCVVDVVDPATTYIGAGAVWAEVHPGAKRILRTARVTLRDNLGAAITSPTPKLLTLTSGGIVTTGSFTGAEGASEVLQSTRLSGVSHTDTGTGYTDEGSYSFFAVGYGYAAQFKNVNVKTANAGNSGVPLSATVARASAVDVTPYSDVVTAPFAFSTTGSGTLTLSASATTQQLSNYLYKLAFDNADTAFWRGINHAPVSLVNGTFDFGAISIVATKNTTTLSGSPIKTAGTITSTDGALITASVEDSAGVRVTVRKSGGGNFNIAARRGTTGAYTDLGFQSDVSSVTYTVPKGTPVEVVMWALGYVTYARTISTTDGGVVLDAEMTVNSSINTALDVSSYLANISLSLDTSGATPFFVITFNASMTVSGIELGKALVHRLVGQEVALRSGFPPGSTSTIVINADEITNQLPAVRLDVGASIPVTGRVYLDFFINMVAAKAVNSSYAINPPRADGNQVQILRAKPALDASQLSAAVWSASQRTLTSASTARPSIDF